MGREEDYPRTNIKQLPHGFIHYGNVKSIKMVVLIRDEDIQMSVY